MIYLPLTLKTQHGIQSELKAVKLRIDRATRLNSLYALNWENGNDTRDYIESIERELRRIRETIIY